VYLCVQRSRGLGDVLGDRWPGRGRSQPRAADQSHTTALDKVTAGLGWPVYACKRAAALSALTTSAVVATSLAMKP